MKLPANDRLISIEPGCVDCEQPFGRATDQCPAPATPDFADDTEDE